MGCNKPYSNHSTYFLDVASWGWLTLWLTLTADPLISITPAGQEVHASNCSDRSIVKSVECTLPPHTVPHVMALCSFNEMKKTKQNKNPCWRLRGRQQNNLSSVLQQRKSLNVCLVKTILSTIVRIKFKYWFYEGVWYWDSYRIYAILILHSEK